MRTRLLLWLTLAASALVATIAAGVSAAPTRDTRVRPGVGIGRVVLGMTAAEVRRAMGRRQDSTSSEERSFGSRYVELVWDSGPEDYLSVGLGSRCVTCVTCGTRT